MPPPSILDAIANVPTDLKDSFKRLSACKFGEIFAAAGAGRTVACEVDVPGEDGAASGALRYRNDVLSGLLTRWTRYESDAARSDDPFAGYDKAVGAVGIREDKSFWLLLDGYEEVTEPICVANVLIGRSATGTQYEVSLSVVDVR
jgi:uncharacterized protein YbaA (DUF1428 family)